VITEKTLEQMKKIFKILGRINKLKINFQIITTQTI